MIRLMLHTGGPVWSQELDFMTLAGPCQLQIFYDYQDTIAPIHMQEENKAKNKAKRGGGGRLAVMRSKQER